MTMQERIEKAHGIVQKYWDMMCVARKFGNEDYEKYWLHKWSAACEVYDIITGIEWKQEE